MESSTVSSSSSNLRIACLEPSATAICLELGLVKNIVGVTHECQSILNKYNTRATASADDADSQQQFSPLVLTRNGLAGVTSQADIHRAVQESVTRSQEATKLCPIMIGPSTAASTNDMIVSASATSTTYPLIEENIKLAQPNIIFTQDLCDVCAPTSKDVQRCLSSSSLNNNKVVQDNNFNPTTTANDVAVSKIQTINSSKDDGNEEEGIKIVSLQPKNLMEVAETFEIIGTVCKIKEHGKQLRQDFLNKLQILKETIEEHVHKKPSMLILEWLDPVFDSGHWTYQMMEYACVQNARRKLKNINNYKATVIEWKDVHDADPDVVVIGCCGFDLERNRKDVILKKEQFRTNCARAAKNNRIYASNGDMYIAQPSPYLLQGVALLAQCAYQDQPNVLNAITNLGYQTIGWKAVHVLSSDDDIEDMMGVVKNDYDDGFAIHHENACRKGELMYEDPETQYYVFTRIAHEKRGKCCGSGCRHCPYSHVNVKNKAAKIQQPSVLYEQQDIDNNDAIFSVHQNKNNIKVLFFSGGKDSFLTIRELVRSYYHNGPFGLVLLTTFDANTRIIAHQEVGIDQVIKQALHLNITLIGIPLRRGSGETYIERIKLGLELIQRQFSPGVISGLVFGDLHLSHIKEWRDNILPKMLDFSSTTKLEYPLWKKPYSKLMDDLELSTVPCTVSGTTRKAEVPVGVPFDRNLYEQLCKTHTDDNPGTATIDSFGECGEFHSLAKVWEVPRSSALGLRK